MTLSKNFIVKNQNLSTFPENNSQTVEQIYDKYAPIVYQIINSLTDNVAISEKIFINTIFSIKDNISQFNINGIIYPNLMRFTYNFAVQELISYGISPNPNSDFQESKLTYLLCTRCKSLQDVALLLNIPFTEVRHILRQEYLEFRQ